MKFQVGDKVYLAEIVSKRFHLLDGDLAFLSATLFFNKEYEISKVIQNGYRLKGIPKKYVFWDELLTKRI